MAVSKINQLDGAALVRSYFVGSQLVKKLLEFYAARRFITAITEPHYLSVS